VRRGRREEAFPLRRKAKSRGESRSLEASMSSPTALRTRPASPSDERSSWPWWFDPYSDNPFAYGLIFLLIILLMIGGLFAYRFLTIGPNAGAHPIGPPYITHPTQILAYVANFL
jgi:hypothetical protein